MASTSSIHTCFCIPGTASWSDPFQAWQSAHPCQPGAPPTWSQLCILFLHQWRENQVPSAADSHAEGMPHGVQLVANDVQHKFIGQHVKGVTFLRAMSNHVGGEGGGGKKSICLWLLWSSCMISFVWFGLLVLFIREKLLVQHVIVMLLFMWSFTSCRRPLHQSINQPVGCCGLAIWQFVHDCCRKKDMNWCCKSLNSFLCNLS